MNTKIITILIMGTMLFAATSVFAAKNYNSSKSNSTSIAIVNQQVGDILLSYSIGGAEINKVTDALAVGINSPNLIKMLVLIYNSAQSNVSNRLINEQSEEGFIKEVLTELDRLGVGINEEGLEAAPPSSTEDVLAPTTAKEIDDAIPILFKEKEKEPQPTTTGAKRSKTTEAKVVLGGIKTTQAAFHETSKAIIQNIRSAAPEEREGIIDELRTNRGTFQTEIVSMNLSIRKNAKELRKNFRSTVAPILCKEVCKGGRIAVAHGKGLRMINRFRSATARFDHILGRLESRVLKLKARGFEVDSFFDVEVYIQEARNISVENEAKIEELKAKYELLLEGENPQGVAEEARAIAKELKAETQNLHAKLREIVDEIKQAAMDYNSSRSNTQI